MSTLSFIRRNILLYRESKEFLDLPEHQAHRDLRDRKETKERMEHTVLLDLL